MTPPLEGTTDDWYVDYRDFNRVIMDGDAGGVPVCFNPASGQLVPPGQRTTVRVGYDSANDPTRAELLVETNGPPVPLVAAPS